MKPKSMTLFALQELLIGLVCRRAFEPKSLQEEAPKRLKRLRISGHDRQGLIRAAPQGTQMLGP